MARLTRRALVCTLAATAALGAGTAAAVMSVSGAPSHLLHAKSWQGSAGRLSARPDPGLVVKQPDEAAPPAAPPTPATTAPFLPPAPPSPPPPPVGAAALSQISYPWQQLHYQVVFLGARSDLMGQTIFDEHRIEIYLRRGESQRTVEHVLAHEIGHAIDIAYNTSERRQRWLQLRGASTSEPWFGCSGCDDFSSPAGDYSETFSFWQVGPDADYSHLAPPPSAEQLKQLVPLFYADAGTEGGSSGQPPPSSGSSGPAPGSNQPPPSGPPPGRQSCLTVVCTSGSQAIVG